MLSPSPWLDSLCCWLLWAIAETEKEKRQFHTASQQESCTKNLVAILSFSITVILQKNRSSFFLKLRISGCKGIKPLKEQYGAKATPLCPLLNSNLFLDGLNKIMFGLFGLWQRIRVCLKTFWVSLAPRHCARSDAELRNEAVLVTEGSVWFNNLLSHACTIQLHKSPHESPSCLFSTLPD